MTQELQGLLEGATPGPWQIQDGCSWRRIGTAFHDGDVLCPTNSRTDGHPDLVADDGKLYANLKLIVAAVNALPELLASLSAKDAEIAGLRAALANIFNKLDRGEGAPGHSHDVAGIWDADNAPGVAGTKCEWCAQWDAARALHQNPELKA